MKRGSGSIVAKFLTVLLLSVGLGASCKCATQPPNSAGQELKSASDFRLESLAGDKVQLSSFRGKSVFVHFWASWCPPCLPELPQLISFASKVEKKGWILLAVSTDTEWSKVKRAMPSGVVLPRNFYVLLDSDSQVAESYGSFMYPETYWVSPEGKIQAKWVGPQEWEELTEQLK